MTTLSTIKNEYKYYTCNIFTMKLQGLESILYLHRTLYCIYIGHAHITCRFVIDWYFKLVKNRVKSKHVH